MKLKYKMIVLVVTGLLFQNVTILATEKATLVHNTKQEIEACEGKLQLKWIRTWGGNEEEDELKFFEFPVSVAVDKNKNIYICDQNNHQVRVYDLTGKYIRTIGRRGRGPGDIFGPQSICISPNGDLWVGEQGGRRVQCFSNTGKSKSIFKHKRYIRWLGVTAKNEIAVFSRQRSVDTGKLIAVYNDKGKCLREIGVYHEPSKNLFSAEILHFAKDNRDNFYAANTKAPILRKYSNDGKLLMAITFETLAKLPPKVVLDETGNDIVRQEIQASKVRLIKTKDGRIIFDGENKRKENPKNKFNGCFGIGTDFQENIYVVVYRRELTKKESESFHIMGKKFVFIDRSQVNFDIVENIDIYRLLVFNPAGKVIGEARLNSICNSLYVHDNRLFIVDGLYNQRILEYEINLKK
jgi:6-bladed beta-propeller